MNARSKDGSTPFHLASKDKSLKVAHLLFEHSTEIGAEDNEGMTTAGCAEE